MPFELPPSAPWDSPNDAALALQALHLSRRAWLLRRVDRAVYVDDTRLRWDTTFEVQIPTLPRVGAAFADDDEFEEALRLERIELLPDIQPMPLPLIVKHRALLTGFELTDGTGAPVRTLTWEESKPLVAGMLTAHAEGIIDGAARAARRKSPGLHRRVADLLEAWDEDERTNSRARGLLEALSATMPADARLSHESRQAHLLLADKVFGGVLNDLGTGFLVIAVVDIRRAEHRVFRLRHEEVSEERRIDLIAGSARSYHAEIGVPRGVSFRDAVTIDPTNLPQEEGVPGPAGDFWHAELDDDLLAIHAVPATPEARISVDLLDSICNPREGLVARVWLVAWVTFAMFAGGVLARLAHIHPDVGAAAPILAALPTAYALLVLQDSRSRTHEAVVREPRAVLTGFAALTFAGACVLAADFPPSPVPLVGSLGWGWRGFAWLVLAVVAVVTALWTVTVRLRRWCGTSTP